MNAHTPVLTPLALEQADLLKRLQAQDFPTKTQLAEDLGRDLPNLGKTIKRLQGEGWVDDVWLLTPAGANAVRMIAMLSGDHASTPSTPIPGGVGGLLHAQIIADPNNPRTDFDPDGLQELKASIIRDGLVEPLVVRRSPGDAAYMLIAGERRWRAIGLAIGEGAWRADQPIDVTVKDVDEPTARRLALVENLQRRDLKPLEEAHSIQALMDLTGDSAAQIGRDLGFTERWAQQRLALLKLPAELQYRISQGDLTIEKARDAASLWPRLPPIKQIELREGKITVEAAKQWVDARPKPLTLEIDTELALVELAWQIAAKKGAARYTDVPCAFDAPKGPEISGSTLWTVSLTDEGRGKVVIGFAGWDHLRAITNTDMPLDRDTLAVHVLRAQRRYLGDREPAERDLVFTGWLTPPFPTDPAAAKKHAAQKAKIAADNERYAKERRDAQAKREQEQDEREASQQALQEKAARETEEATAFAADLQAFEDRAGIVPYADLPGEIALLIKRAGYEGPFTVQLDDRDGHHPEAVIVDALGEHWRAAPAKIEILRRLMVIGLNVALGLPPTSGERFKAPWSKDDEAEELTLVHAGDDAEDSTPEVRLAR